MPEQHAPQQAPQQPRSIATGVAFLVFGLIVLVPSGLCTGLFGGGALIELATHPQSADVAPILLMALIFGGPFVLFGAFMVRLGIRHLRGK